MRRAARRRRGSRPLRAPWRARRRRLSRSLVPDRVTAPQAAAALGAGTAFAGAVWWIRVHPTPLPYSQRLFVQVPHPLLRRRRLLRLLALEPGETLLEVGPGTGLYTLALADGVGAAGTVSVLDAQREMLDHTLAAARRRGLANISASEGDARDLPFSDDAFDVAVMVRTLGEVPDQEQALSELKRVLRPGGRLAVGEAADDPHFVSHRALVRRAETAGLTLDGRIGGPLAYFALLRG